MRAPFSVPALALAALIGAVTTTAAQSVLERPPNLSGAWAGSAGTLHFNFLHRFQVTDAPVRKVRSFPTFLLAAGFPASTLLGVHYSTNSDVVAGIPNEWEFFGRWAPLAQSGGRPLDLGLQFGFNEAAESLDAEISLARRFGPARLLLAARGLSDGYGKDAFRWAVAGGASLRLTSHVALAGDVGSLLDRRRGERLAWGAALQLVIPYTPHTLSLQVANTTTATLEGASRGTDQVRVGFEFTIPLTLGRYFRGAVSGEESEPGIGVGAARTERVVVDIRGFAFGPDRIEVTAGTTVAWVNGDAVGHSSTADDGAWDSGLIGPGRRWERTFERPGTYPYHCTPHPFMKGVVIVRAKP
jgi:plastocyanin